MVKVKKVTLEDEGGTPMYHVRWRQPGNFERIRTPGWAANVAESVSKGAKVRMGKTPAGNWLVQSVLLTKQGVRDKNHAKSLASRIRRKIDD